MVETLKEAEHILVQRWTTPQGAIIVRRSPQARTEAAVLAALAGGTSELATPRLLAHDDTSVTMACLPGTDLAACFAAAEPARRETLAHAFGSALARLHRWKPPLPRPTDDALTVALARAERAAATYTAPVDNPCSPFHGWEASAVLIYLQAEAHHYTTELAFCHGDWCLPNVLIEGEQVTGVVDWSDGGWADRRTDLAMGLWTLRYNTPADPALPCYHAAFLAGYGWPGGPETLRFFEGLNELWGE